MPSFRNADVLLHFEVCGDGRPIVFLHGDTVDYTKVQDAVVALASTILRLRSSLPQISSGTTTV